MGGPLGGWEPLSLDPPMIRSWVPPCEGFWLVVLGPWVPGAARPAPTRKVGDSEKVVAEARSRRRCREGPLHGNESVVKGPMTTLNVLKGSITTFRLS